MSGDAAAEELVPQNVGSERKGDFISNFILLT